MGKKIIVAGIGTDVGKTVASAVLVKAWKADYWKPVQTGSEMDRKTIQTLVPEAVCHPECYHFQMPVSPHQAAKAEGKEITSLEVPLHERPLIIEMAGGLMVPLREDWLFFDWAKTLEAEWILVSRYYLGSINHTLLSLAALAGQKVRGLILVGDKNEDTFQVLKKRAPILGELETASINSEQITKWAYGLDNS